MRLLKDNVVGLLFTAAAFAVVAVFYGQMPERVPTHWNVDGVADRFTPKPWGPFLLPILMVGLLVFLNVVRFASPSTAPAMTGARYHGGRAIALAKLW